jgi:hypothetical protein
VGEREEDRRVAAEIDLGLDVRCCVRVHVRRSHCVRACSLVGTLFFLVIGIFGALGLHTTHTQVVHARVSVRV